MHFIASASLVVSSVTRLGYFWKVLATNFLTKAAQIFDNGLGYFEKTLLFK